MNVFSARPHRRNPRAYLAAAVACVVGLLGRDVIATPAPELKSAVSTAYESNVFHARRDTSLAGDAYLDVNAALRWTPGYVLGIRQRLDLYTDLNLYQQYSSRNRTEYGVRYRPTLSTRSFGRFRLKIDVSRQVKDLLDDSGETQPRTLAKTVAEATGEYRYRWNRLTAEAGIEYGSYNYDESYDNNIRLRSYDFERTIMFSTLRYDVARSWALEIEASTERRFYKERLSLSLDKKSSRVRNYRLNELTVGSDANVLEWLRVLASVSVARRTENFEDFYGYDWSKRRLKVVLDPWPRHETSVSISTRRKDYPHYYTTNTGTAHTVLIEYLQVEAEHIVQLSRSWSLFANLDYFNKTSNDPSFAYRNLQLGLGVLVTL